MTARGVVLPAKSGSEALAFRSSQHTDLPLHVDALRGCPMLRSARPLLAAFVWAPLLTCGYQRTEEDTPSQDTYVPSRQDRQLRTGNRYGDCGPASCVSVARALGAAVPKDDEEALVAMRTAMMAESTGGTSMEQVENGLRAYGLRTYSLKEPNIEDLAVMVDCGCALVLSLSPPEGSSKKGHDVAVSRHYYKKGAEYWEINDVNRKAATSMKTSTLSRRLAKSSRVRLVAATRAPLSPQCVDLICATGAEGPSCQGAFDGRDWLQRFAPYEAPGRQKAAQ